MISTRWSHLFNAQVFWTQDRRQLESRLEEKRRKEQEAEARREKLEETKQKVVELWQQIWIAAFGTEFDKMSLQLVNQPCDWLPTMLQILCLHS